MVSASGITAAIASFKAAKDVAQAMISARDITVFQSQMVEFQSKIIDANDAALTAQEERTALLQKVSDLEKEVASFKAWEAEKQRYSLERLTSGSFVYSLKEDACGAEPMHAICSACYQRNQRSILQTVHHHSGRSKSLDCPECGSRVYTNGIADPSHVPPTRR